MAIPLQPSFLNFLCDFYLCKLLPIIHSILSVWLQYFFFSPSHLLTLGLVHFVCRSLQPSLTTPSCLPSFGNNSIPHIISLKLCYMCLLRGRGGRVGYSVELATGWSWVRIPLRQLRFGTLAIPFTPLCQCLSEETIKAVGSFYMVSMQEGSKIAHQSALEMCNLSWTPSLLDKDNCKITLCIILKFECSQYRIQCVPYPRPYHYNYSHLHFPKWNNI